MATFSSAEFAWKDIEVVIKGRSLVRILEIEYTTEAEMKHIYGRGKKAVGIQEGNEKVTGQITIGQSELEALIRSAQQANPGSKITDMPFNINITYRQGFQLVRDRVDTVKVSSIPKGMKQGDTDMIVKLPFLALDVEYNI
jgi:hypothetical protein